MLAAWLLASTVMVVNDASADVIVLPDDHLTKGGREEFETCLVSCFLGFLAEE